MSPFLKEEYAYISCITWATPQRRWGNYTLVDSKDFTFDWCCHYIAGFQFSSVEIWASNDPEATWYALTRARYDGEVTVLLTKSVWNALEKAYIENGMERKHIDTIKAMCDIVEDLNGSD